MRKTVIVLLLSLALLAAVSGCSSGTPEEAEQTVSAESFGADGSDTEDDRHCIQLALNYARDNSSAASPVSVTLGDGTYYIDRGLVLYSHTHLRLSENAVVLLTGEGGTMLYGGDADGSGYDSLTDAEVSGGTWRGGASDSGAKTQLFAFKRASRVTLSGLKMEDSSDHFIMLTGVRDAVVRDCSFRDYVAIASIDQFTKEALHIDFLPLGSNRFFPSENITVENCRFADVASGIGTHHYGYGSYEYGITVRGCTFDRVLYNCVNAYSMMRLRVSGCSVKQCGSFLWCRATNGEILSNSVAGVGERCISVLDGSAVLIKDNSITNVCAEGADGKSIALLAGESSCVIEGNDISHVDGAGIRLRRGSSLSVISGNAISHVLGQGIFVTGARVSVEGNLVEDCQGIWTDSAECVIASNTVSDCLYGVASHCGTSRVSGNTITAPKSIGIKITGTEESGGRAVVEDNTITGSGQTDVNIGRNCSDCIVRRNNAGQGFKIACSVRSDAVALCNGKSPLPAAPSVNCTVGGDFARLSWSKAEGAYDYVIYGYDPETDSLERLTETKDLSFDIEGLAPDERHFYLVTSRGRDGRECVYTLPSNLVDASTGSFAGSVSVERTGGDVSVTEGETACFYTRASGSGLSFRWQVRKKGVSDWSDWSGREAAFITAVAGPDWDGMQVRCRVTDSGGGTAYSEPLELTLTSGAAITMQSGEVCAYKGGPMLFSVAVSGEAYQCRWYYRKAGSRVWVAWKGKDTSWVFASQSEIPDGSLVRCIVTGSDGSDVFSLPMSVSVETPLRIVSEPADVIAEDGEKVEFHIKADGEGTLAYQWYYKKQGDDEWHVWTGHDTAVFSTAANATWHQMKVRCVVTDSTGESLESRELTVTLTE